MPPFNAMLKIINLKLKDQIYVTIRRYEESTISFPDCIYVKQSNLTELNVFILFYYKFKKQVLAVQWYLTAHDCCMDHCDDK